MLHKVKPAYYGATSVTYHDGNSHGDNEHGEFVSLSTDMLPHASAEPVPGGVSFRNARGMSKAGRLCALILSGNRLALRTGPSSGFLGDVLSEQEIIGNVTTLVSISDYLANELNNSAAGAMLFVAEMGWYSSEMVTPDEEIIYLNNRPLFIITNTADGCSATLADNRIVPDRLYYNKAGQLVNENQRRVIIDILSLK